MDPLYYVLITGGFTTLGLIVRTFAASLRHRGDRNFLLHVFDQTRDAEVLKTLEQLNINAIADAISQRRMKKDSQSEEPASDDRYGGSG